MKTSETIGNLLTALSSAQGEIQNAEKDVQGYGYKYADLGQILNIVRPILTKHKLAVIQIPHNADGGIAVTTRIGHESGEWLEDTLVLPVEQTLNKEGNPTLSIAQESGKVITYARRYMLSAVLGVAQEDTDATKADSKGQPQETKKRELPKKPANAPTRDQITALQKSISEVGLDIQEVWKNAGCQAGKWSELSMDDYKRLSETVLNMSAVSNEVS
jgi:hypothetical protein